MQSFEFVVAVVDVDYILSFEFVVVVRSQCGLRMSDIITQNVHMILIVDTYILTGYLWAICLYGRPSVSKMFKNLYFWGDTRGQRPLRPPVPPTPSAKKYTHPKKIITWMWTAKFKYCPLLIYVLFSIAPRSNDIDLVHINLYE
jgi:hypothetical protein